MKKIGGHFKKWNNQFLKCNWRACNQLIFSFAVWGVLKIETPTPFSSITWGAFQKMERPFSFFLYSLGCVIKT
jgi:hypothetical protein